MSENQVNYKCDQCDKTYIRKHFFDSHIKSKHGEQQDNQQLNNTIDAARPPQINLDVNQDKAFFEDLDIPDDLELFEDIASEEEIIKLAEDIENSLAEMCGECSIKDRYVHKIKLKIKAFEKSKRLLQKLVKDKNLLLEDAREKLAKKTAENVALNVKLETKLVSEALESWEPEVQVVELKCPKCDNKFSSNQELKMHIDQNHFKYTCKQCNIIFPNQIGHDVHMKKKHSQNFQCEMCDTKLETKYSLERHISQVHTPVNHVQCIMCPFSDKNEDIVIKHMDKTHFNIPNKTKYTNKTDSFPCKNGVTCTYLRDNRCKFSHENDYNSHNSHNKVRMVNHDLPTNRVPKQPQEQVWQEVKRRQNKSDTRKSPSEQQRHVYSSEVVACKFGDSCDKGRLCSFRHRDFGKYRLVFPSNQSRNRKQ